MMMGKTTVAFRRLGSLFLTGALVLASGAKAADFAPDGVPFVVAKKTWPADGLGNHRAVVRVPAGGGVARAFLKWRRVDPRPEIKRVLVKRLSDGADVPVVVARGVCAESGEILFDAPSGGEYAVYYLPYRERVGSREGRAHPTWNDYFPPPDARSEKLLAARLGAPGARAPVKAEVLRFESRTAFEAWTEMGLCATAAELAALRRAHPGNPVVFTEDRAHPIHPASWLPAKWAKGTEARATFAGTALKDEYYVWQLALWTPGGGLKNVKVAFSDLVLQSAGGASNVREAIPASAITCFNTEGTNWDGKPMTIRLDVPVNRLQPLWCGVMIPRAATPGVYRGTAVVSAEGMSPREVALSITVADQTIQDHGDGELWRHSRLRWLNSRIGDVDAPTSLYEKMVSSAATRTIRASDKTVTLGSNGLPSAIAVGGRGVLKAPMTFAVETDRGQTRLGAGNFTLTSATDGHVAWTSTAAADGITFTAVGRMEFDGFLRFSVDVASARACTVKNVRLETAYTPAASTYMMGLGYLGREGGTRPASYTWTWKGPYDSYWTGGADAGVHVEFRGGAYHGPLIADRSYRYQPPAPWANDGRGRVVFCGTDGLTVVAQTGETALSTVPRRWEFDLNLTPVKPLDLKGHFSQRYYHADPAEFEAAAAKGANIVNIHHARRLNPVINYPFIVQKELKAYIAEQHAKNRKVKLYYTIRELSNHTVELQALRSLGSEVIAPGNAHGAAWLWEHMGEGYRPAWYVRMMDGSVVDAAFVTTPLSRWINYYLEGLRWMFENYKIDGVYMDDVCFDRTVMKRMRRIIEKYRPGALIDLHSNTSYSKGAMNQYTEFFPYVDRLWFGEWFRYNEMTADSWFVTFSGIPFGLMGEMLQGGGNPWLGAVYGTTRRLYGKIEDGNPGAIWKLWSDFGIEKAQMIGYWDEKPAVTTGDDGVKATAFVRDGRVFVALGNFLTTPRTVKLGFDWARLGLDPASVQIVAPEITSLQKRRAFAVDEAIVVPPKRGWFLLLESTRAR
jgi:hypothetical protein